MDINQSSLSRYKTVKTGISRLPSDKNTVKDDTHINEKQAFSEQSMKQLGLRDGQTIRGQIIDHRYNEVQIRLEPGNQVVTAKLSGDIPLSIGQEASFQVTQGMSDSLVLKYIPEDKAAMSDMLILKALTASNLPVTDKTKAIVQELLNQNMPVDKNTLQALIKQSHINRDTTPMTLVLMHKNNIPMTPENIKQFELYQNGTNKLINDIRTITGNISKLLPDLGHMQIENTDVTSNLQINSTIPNKSTELLPPTTDQKPQTTEIPLPGDPKALADDPSKELSPLQNVLKKMFTINTGLIDLLYNNSDSAGPSGQPIQEIRKDIPLSDILKPSEQIQLSEYMKDYPDPDGTLDMLKGGALGLQKFLTYIQEKLPQNEQTAIKLLESPEYSKLLENSLLDKWTLTPEDIAKKAPVQELYQKLEEDISKLNQLIKAVSEEDVPHQVRDSMKNLQENVTFMKDLNEMLGYVQLPVQLKDRNIHSDLYVFTRKKSLREKPDSISVLLHLDMDHLGPLNIHIQMNQSLIHAKFYTEDQAAERLFYNNLPLLEESLNKKGYQLQSEIINSYKEPEFITDFITQDSPDSTMKRYTFDIRT
jgi:hypothetical protein